MQRRVVILGAGFAGTTVARRLERSTRSDEIDIVLVNRENYTLFTPMLPEVASGALSPRHVAPPLRAQLKRTTFVLGDVVAVDLATRSVTVARHRLGGDMTLPFDDLVVALGAENSTHGTPGADVHTLPLKTLGDAVRLRDVAITALENAANAQSDAERRRLTTFVVVGGGFTGVEAAGELLAFLRSAARFYPRVERADVRVVLVAGSDLLLEQLPRALGARARLMLERRGVEVVLGDRVAAVDAGGLTLASGARHDSACVVWSAGVRPAPLAAKLGLPVSKHHAIVVGRDFAVPGVRDVWALGDCAQIPKPGGGFYPQTAQHATHEAGRLASNLVASLRGRRTKPYAYRGRGMMASLGAREGVADVGGRITLSGPAAWFLWRSYYLWRLPGADRKARVALDWTLDLSLPADIASVR